MDSRSTVGNVNKTRTQRAALISSCGAHIVQDGLVALQYVLLPIMAQSLGLSYSQVGFLRAVSSTALSLLEMPAGILAERFGERRLLVFGLLGAAVGYFCVALSPTFIGVALGFLIAGAGAAFQHSLSSSLIVEHFRDQQRRRALGAYNSCGDAGKLAFTGLFSVAVGAGFAWHGAVVTLAAAAIVLALLITIVWRPMNTARTEPAGLSAQDDPAAGGWGVRNWRRFSVLGLVVYLDSTVQAIFLTFLALVLIDKGVAPGTAAIGVTIALAGGMMGKYVCGYLAAQIGDRRAFQLIQLLTAAGLVLLTMLSGSTALFALPLIGLVVQGSSTITYGSVADHIHAQRQSRGYSMIYTLGSIASVIGPIVFGLAADRFGLPSALMSLCALVLLTVPMSFVLSARFGQLPPPIASQ